MNLRWRIQGLLLALAAAGLNFGSIRAAEPITVQSVYLLLSDEIDVPAREAGVLASVRVAEGRFASEGELLANVEDREARLARDRVALEVEVAKRQADMAIELDLAKKALEVARTELQRAERSRKAVAGAVSQAEVDRLKLEVEKMASEIQRIERNAGIAAVTAQLKEAEHALAALKVERHQIAAPIAGRVVEHYRRRGEWVEPGQNVLRMVRLDVLRAEGFVPANSLATDPTGAPVTLRINLPGKEGAEFTGRVSFVASEVEPTTGEVLIRADIDNEDLLLRPGLSAEMEILTESPIQSATADGASRTPE